MDQEGERREHQRHWRSGPIPQALEGRDSALQVCLCLLEFIGGLNFKLIKARERTPARLDKEGPEPDFELRMHGKHQCLCHVREAARSAHGRDFPGASKIKYTDIQNFHFIECRSA